MFVCLFFSQPLYFLSSFFFYQRLAFWFLLFLIGQVQIAAFVCLLRFIRMVFVNEKWKMLIFTVEKRHRSEEAL